MISRSSIKQIGQFVVIGVVNTGVDFLILNTLIFLFGASTTLWYVTWKAISFVIANINSYFWNTRFTFNANRTMRSFGEFFSATLVGLAVNIGVAAIVFWMIRGMISEVFAGNIGALVGTFGSLVVNFILYKYVVFRKHLESHKNF